MVNTIIEYDSDVVVAGMSRDLFSVSTKINSKIPAGNYVGERLTRLKQNMLTYEKFSRIGITTYVWNKLFKREMLKKYQMKVNNSITIGEDAGVTYPYLMACNKISVIDNYDYHYRQREDSMLKTTTAYSKEVIGLRLLYLHLMSAANNYADSLNYKNQIRDFLLGLCIIRSGGILKEIKDDFSPYGREFYGSDIVIYSAGTFGQQLMARIKENEYCNVIGWVDTDYKEYRKCCLDVDPIENIDFMSFDYLLIATVDGVIADNIRTNLIWRGLSMNKILNVNCPEEKRTHLLDKYLSI